MYSNSNWAGSLIRCCYDLGVRHFCIAPGSRSAPLALACFHASSLLSGIKLHTHFDERGLAFLALAISRACDQPVVLICTSGTAVANMYPAVLEAWQCRVKLWVFSADRPDRLLHCGANQAIQQKELFGKNVVGSFNFIKPHNRDACVEQWARMSEQVSENGPVQLNCQFDEPLYEHDAGYIKGLEEKTSLSTHVAKSAQTSGELLAGQLNRLSAPPINLTITIARLLAAFKDSEYRSTIVILGSLSPSEAVILQPWLEQLKCAVIADISSQFRFAEYRNLISHADLLLVKPALLSADRILQFGGRIVSKRVNQWLAESNAQYYLLDQNSLPLDPTKRAQQLQIDFAEFTHKLSPESLVHGGIDKLKNQNNLIANSVENLLLTDWNEAAVCQSSLERMTGRIALMPGNSLSIRMLDSYSTKTRASIDVYANRGASGIDGLIASACGLASGAYDQIIAVIGDTSFLHDLNSLALLKALAVPVKILVLNNNGGQIFSCLPSAKQDGFEQLFSMPHGYSFNRVCEQFNVAYGLASSRAQFDTVVEGWLNQKHSAVLECQLPEGAQYLKALSSEVTAVL